MSESSAKTSNAKTNSTTGSAAAVFAAMDSADRAAATADAKGWEPKDGDELRGLVIAIKSGVSEFKERAGRNPNYPIVFVMSDDDTDNIVAVHCFQTVLENEVRAQRPMPGENIYIKRLGANPDKTPKKGESPVIRYAVYVERETGTSDPWEHMQ